MAIIFAVCIGAPTSILFSQTSRQPLMAFDKYHSVEEIESYLDAITTQHSALTTLLEIGRSRMGRPILAVEINNPDTGPAEEKPGFYVDGNIHGGEVLGGEGALYFIDYLLGHYGTNPDITSLIDARSFYVVPIVNPDGRAISVDSPENHRWNVRPVDEDGDGAVDEDPPEDLDGDGRILQMRVPNPEGRWEISPDDPRMMVRRKGGDGSGAYFDVFSEGIDNDGDGSYNEDRVGGVDLNRNFPANWDPAQFASGPYPLSEPETHALVEYITSRPNIAAIHTFHTSGGLLLRFPTLADQNWEFPPQDLEDYRAIAEDGVKITGYSNYAYSKQEIVDLMHPGHGVFNDWGSKVFGVLAMTTEMWQHNITGDRKALFEWNDEVLGGKGFIDWHPFNHPQLGAIELGGWDRWSIANPPEHMIAAELERNVRWVVTFAEKLPRVAILESSVVRRQNVSNGFEISATVANVGWMPTATTHAREVLKIAKPVRVELLLVNAELVSGDMNHELGVLPGARESGPDKRKIAWQVRLLDRTRSAEAVITVWSQKAGTARRRILLGPG
ncbi:MAG: M14 family metallopeptidase [Gemmatimonadales bacterium]